VGEQYIGEIRLFPYNRIPSDWQPCNGQLLQIQQYQALFSLLSTTFGGDGKTTFALPDLRGRAVIGAGGGTMGVSNQVGAKGGTETITLTPAQMPQHNHALQATGASGTGGNPLNSYFSVPTPPTNLTNPPASPNLYGSPQATGATALNSAAIQPTGSSQPHENRQPFMALVYCMAILGYYPQRN